MNYIENARKRAARRKSTLQLLVIGAGFIFMLGLYAIALRGIDLLHQLLYPSQALANAPPGIAVLLAAIPPFLGGIPVGLILGNALAWVLRPARRALDAQAHQSGGEDFPTAQRQLIRAAAVLTPASLLLAAVGALLPWR